MRPLLISLEAMGHLASLADGAHHRIAVPPGTTVAGLLRRFAAEHPAFGSVAFDQAGRFTGNLQVVIGGRLLDLAGGWERTLSDGDELLLLPPFVGG